MATDEEVLGRSLGVSFGATAHGHLSGDLAEKLYTIHRFENEQTEMNLIFRDHTLSDLIGFVYSGMPPQDAASHLMNNIKQAAQPIFKYGHDAVVPIILDGENAWEYYPQSGREFLRRFYDALQREAGVEATTVSEAISGTSSFAAQVAGSGLLDSRQLQRLDWRAGRQPRLGLSLQRPQLLCSGRSRGREEQRKLAFEEILIAEGSDWNWWYGPEHHSANDREFDELYRKHLSNMYQLLGAARRTICRNLSSAAGSGPAWSPQTAYIHPRITGDMVRYFEWMGAAVYTADRRAGAMHGKQFLLDAVHAGIDDTSIYGRLDFTENKVPEADFELVVNLESWADQGQRPRRALRLDAAVEQRRIRIGRSAFPTPKRQALRCLSRPAIRSPSRCSGTSNSRSPWSGCWPLP